MGKAAWQRRELQGAQLPQDEVSARIPPPFLALAAPRPAAIGRRRDLLEIRGQEAGRVMKLRCGGGDFWAPGMYEGPAIWPRGKPLG